MEITKQIIDQLNDENIIKKNYDKIIDLINKKVGLIWETICDKSNRPMKWWAFSNDIEYGNGNGSSGGSFDIKHDYEFIEIIGENQSHKSNYYELNDGFPTEFLWIDYKKAIDDHLRYVSQKEVEEKNKKNLAKDKSKAEKARIINGIKKKLNAEELKLVKFIS